MITILVCTKTQQRKCKLKQKSKKYIVLKYIDNKYI